MKIEDVKLGIGLPLIDEKVHSLFLDTFVLMRKPSYIYLRPRFPDKEIWKIRNQLVTQALKNECTHLLMIDTDQVYNDPETIFKLLAHDLPMVSAIVHRRYPPFDPILYSGSPGMYNLVGYDEDAGKDKIIQVVEEARKNKQLIEIDATGCGCILYNMDVFKNIDPPWFQVEFMADGKPIGEDIGFCNKLKKAGYKIYCDPTIDVEHLSTLAIGWGTFLLYDKLKKLRMADEARNEVYNEGG